MKKNEQHGHCNNLQHTPTYNSWAMMMQRCYNPQATGYSNYGGRGITVCRRWWKFENFLADMGERPEERTLGRRKNDRNYSKRNCQWETRKQQRANQSAMTAWGGMTRRQIADMLSMTYSQLRYQHRLGRTYDEIISEHQGTT